MVSRREIRLAPLTNRRGMWVCLLKGFRLAKEDQEGRGLSSEEKQVLEEDLGSLSLGEGLSFAPW